MPYKLVAIKSLTAAAIMYVTVISIYSGYVWPAVSLKPVLATYSASSSLNPSEPGQTTTVEETKLIGAPPAIPDLFISPVPKTQTQPSVILKAEGGVKRSSSEVSEANLNQISVKQESGKKMKTEGKLKVEKGFSNTHDGLN